MAAQQASAVSARRCFTVSQPRRQHGVPVKPWLLAWGEALAANGGQPSGALDAWRFWQLVPGSERRGYFTRR